MNYRSGIIFAIVFLVAAAGCHPADSTSVRWMESESTAPPDAICKALMKHYMDINTDLELVYVEYEKIIGADDWYVARVDWEYSWWGSFDVFRWDGNRIVSYAYFTHETDVDFNQSIDTVESFRMPQFDSPIIQIIDTTHRGNRSMCLAELDTEAGKLRLLCEARITLQWDDRGRYDLSQSLKDMNGDGFQDIVLEGTLTVVEEDGQKTIESPVRKVFLYKSDEKTFRMSLADSTGVNPHWDDHDSGYGEAIAENSQD